MYSSTTVLKKTVHDFFIRDDVSRATAGKKDTLTKAAKGWRETRTEGTKKAFKRSPVRRENSGGVELECGRPILQKRG
jgi:hypothetical protein